MKKPVYVRLTQEEFDRLREVALKECRDPREHARYLIRVGLGLSTVQNSELDDLRRRVERLEALLSFAATGEVE